MARWHQHKHAALLAVNEPTRHCLAWIVRSLASADYVCGILSDPADCADTLAEERREIFEVGALCEQLSSRLETVLLRACRREPGRTRAASLDLYRLMASLPVIPAHPGKDPQSCGVRNAELTPAKRVAMEGEEPRSHARLTDETRAMVAQLAADGLNNKQIAEQLDMPASTVASVKQRWKQQQEIELPAPAVPEPTPPTPTEPEPMKLRRKPRSKLTAEQITDVLQRLSAGEPQAAVAAAFDVSQAYVSSLKVRNETHAQRKRRQRLTPEQLETVLEMLDHGDKQMDIARIHNCSRSLIAAIKAKHRPSNQEPAGLDQLVAEVLAG